jgi:hypothetical protein
MPAVAVAVAGAPGIVDGVTEDVVAAAPGPFALIATIENVYAVPFVRPVKLQVRFAVAVQLPGGATVGVDVTE